MIFGLGCQGNVVELYWPKRRRRAAPRTVGSVSLRKLESRGPAAHDPTKSMPAKLFVTTLNVGGVKDVASLGDIKQWIPPGYDIYCIGLQECLILEDLR